MMFGRTWTPGRCVTVCEERTGASVAIDDLPVRDPREQVRACRGTVCTWPGLHPGHPIADEGLPASKPGLHAGTHDLVRKYMRSLSGSKRACWRCARESTMRYGVVRALAGGAMALAASGLLGGCGALNGGDTGQVCTDTRKAFQQYITQVR